MLSCRQDDPVLPTMNLPKRQIDHGAPRAPRFGSHLAPCYFLSLTCSDLIDDDANTPQSACPHPLLSLINFGINQVSKPRWKIQGANSYAITAKPKPYFQLAPLILTNFQRPFCHSSYQYLILWWRWPISYKNVLAKASIKDCAFWAPWYLFILRAHSF